MHLIGDKLTVTGMRLGGLKEAHVANKENVGKVLEKVSEESRMILITQGLVASAREVIEKLRKKKKVIIEIPDQSGGGEDFVNKLVKEVIGFELKR